MGNHTRVAPLGAGFGSFDTLADLALAGAGLAPGVVVYVAENGGSYWSWYPTGSTPPAGAQTTAGNGGVWGKLDGLTPGDNGFVSVLTFPGVMGDGVHDDSPGITAAIAFCTPKGITLWFPVPPVAYLLATPPALLPNLLVRVAPGASFLPTQPPFLSPASMVGNGTLASPAPSTSIWAAQPVDLTRGPFGAVLATQKFNSTWDNVLFVGYNPAGASSTEPTLRLGVEHDYEATPGAHLSEMYFEMIEPGGTFGIRPIYAYQDRNTGTAQVAFQEYAGTFVFQDRGPLPAQLWGMGFTGTLVGAQSIDMTTGIPIVDVGGGGHPATIGQIRLQAHDHIAWRDNANAVNVQVGMSVFDGANALDMGDVSGTVGLRFQGFPIELVAGGVALTVSPAFLAGSDQFAIGFPINGGLLKYTFPGDANQALSAVDSRKNILIVEAGIILAPRTIRASGAPVIGTMIWVRNTNAQIVTYAWATGTGIAVAPGTSALIVADGTNAVLVMAGT